jgi:hypothetical protein
MHDYCSSEDIDSARSVTLSHRVDAVCHFETGEVWKVAGSDDIEPLMPAEKICDGCYD